MKFYIRSTWFAYVYFSTFLVSVFLSLGAYGTFLERTQRADLPNGAYLNRANPFSDEIVLRDPNGTIVMRDISHVLFNDRYVAGEFYETPYSSERFVYKVGDDRAFRDGAGDDDPFEAMLEASGLESEWPWGAEDPNWLDYKRLLVRLGTRGPFPE